MEKWIKSQSHFTQIENKNLERPDFQQFGLPIEEKSLGSVIKYKLGGNSKRVLFTYQLEGNLKHYRSKPLEFINSLVKSRHKEGLYQHLTSSGLALDVDADV
jgi:insulysin